MSAISKHRRELSSLTVPDLTKREQEVLALIEQGLFDEEIAERIHRSTSTTKKHVRVVLAKFGARTKTELLAKRLDEIRRAHAPRPSRKPRTVSEGQRGKLFAEAGEHDGARDRIAAKEDVLRAASAQFGRKIRSVDDLTYREASWAIDWLLQRIEEATG